MKKTLVALAALSTLGAYAQSTVQISGILNAGAARSNAGVLSVAGLKGDRNNLSFDVTEDMGGGSKAIAKVQFRWNVATGTTGYSSTLAATEQYNGGTLVEQSMIGFTDNTLGTVKIGRFTNDVGTHDFSVFEDSGQGTNASAAAYGRLSGTVQWTSPTYGGFKVSAINAKAAANCYTPAGGAGFGTVAGINYCTYSATGINNFGAGVLTYENGPLLLQGASIGGLYGDKNTRLSARYTMGAGTKLYYGMYKQSGAVGTLLSTMTTTATYAIPVAYNAAYGWQSHTNTELGASVPVGAFTFRAAYLTSNNDIGYTTSQAAVTDGTTKYSKVSLGGEYNLSKRTMAMVQAGKGSNSSAAIAAGGSVSFTGDWPG
jgi:predicted porin